MIETEPGVRRMCVAVAGKPGLLASACLLIEFDRLYVYVFTDPGGGTQLAVAPPGIDEAGLASDLVAALRVVAAAEAGSDPALSDPTLLALHVGIVHVRGENFVGSAVDRVVGLVRGGAHDSARHPGAQLQAAASPVSRGAPLSEPTASAGQPSGLLAAITEPLFADLLGEGWPADGWHWQSPSDAWLKRYPPLVG